MAQRWRAYHAGPAPRPGELVELGAEERHYVQRVLRLAPGDRLSLFDGRGGEWIGALEGDARGSPRLRVERALEGRVEAALELVLFTGCQRAEKLEWVIQKATELGVAAVRPCTASREPTRGPALRLERAQRIALEACRQCGRRVVPRIEPVGQLPAVPAGTVAIVLDPRPGTPPVATALSRTAPGDAWLAAGGESGFEGGLEAALAGGWVAAGLGPRTLRAETAAIVGAALVLHAWGDLGSAADPAGREV